MRPPPRPDQRRPSPRPALLGAVLAVLLLAGCSSAPVTPEPMAVRPAVLGAAASSSPAAELQAGLTALLVERTYAVAAATEAVITAQGRLGDPGPTAALDALGNASAALADILGATYSGARAPLGQALRRDDALLAQHAVALASGDVAAAAEVRASLEQAEGELARVVRQVVPALDAAELAERLGNDLLAQVAAAGPDPWAALRAAAVESARTARLLAAGIAADRGLGGTGTGAALLRADVTALLTQHVALVGALGRGAATPGSGDGVGAALSANAEQLGDLVGEAYPAARAPFLRAWQAHLDRLTRYAGDRAAGREGEPGLLLGFPDELARLLAEHVGGLPAETVAAELVPAQASLLDALTAAADGEPRAAGALRTAVVQAQPAAALLAAGIAEDLRLP